MDGWLGRRRDVDLDRDRRERQDVHNLKETMEDTMVKIMKEASSG
jgi:hypothetical protein